MTLTPRGAQCCLSFSSHSSGPRWNVQGSGPDHSGGNALYRALLFWSACSAPHQLRGSKMLHRRTRAPFYQAP